MNDDLNLLISFVSTSDVLVKVAIKIHHGMSRKEWENWEYFKEEDIETLLLASMPLHVQTFCKTILAVEDIFYIQEK